MDKKLHLLDSFNTLGSDGAAYKVLAYEHMLRVDLLADGQDHWEPTGMTEYRLASGERVDVAPDGAMHVVPTGVELHRAGTEQAPSSGKPASRRSAAMKFARASARPSPRGSRTWRSRKKPVSAKPSAMSCSDGSSANAWWRKAGSTSSLCFHGSPASRETARPDFGDT